MKNTFKLLITSALLSASMAQAAVNYDSGYNAKLIDEVSERGGFNDKSYQNGGFNDKAPEKEIQVGWKKH